ncbi:MAG: PAS domain S-box protein, partial [Bacteroidales bacterium]
EQNQFWVTFIDITKEKILSDTYDVYFHEKDIRKRYQIICDNLLSISNAKYASLNIFDDNGKDFTTVALSGIQKNIIKACRIAGIQFTGKRWEHDPRREALLKKNQLTRFEKLRNLTHGVMPDVMSHTLEMTFGLGEVSILKIMEGDKLVGDFTIIMNKGETFQYNNEIKLFANQVGLIIAKEKSDQLLNNFFDISIDLLCIADTEGNFIRLNKAWEKLLGYDLATLSKKNFMDLIHPEDISATQKMLKKLADQEQITDFANRYLAHDGTYKYIQWSSHSSGKHIYASARDITEKVHFEEALKSSEKRYRSLFNQSNDAVFILDLDGKHLAANGTGTRMLGYSNDEMLKLSISDLSAEYPESEKIFGRLLQGETIPPYEQKMKHKNGQIIDVEINAELIRDINGKPLHVQSVVRDISERKKIENQLIKSDLLLKKLSRQIPGVIYQYQYHTDTGKNYFPFASENIYDIYEVWPEDVKDDASVVLSKLHPDDHDHVVASIIESAKTLNNWEYEYRVILSRGIRWLHGIAHPEKQHDGSVLWHGFISDITDKKNAQIQLHRIREQYQLSVEGSNDGIWDWDLVTDELFLSPRYKSMIGYKDHELENKFSTFEERIHPDDKKKVFDTLELYFEKQIITFEVEFRFRHRNNNYIWVLGRGKALRDPKGKPYRMAGSHTDITSRKMMEEAVMESQEQLESVLQSQKELICRFKSDTTLTFVNQSYAVFFGKKPVDLIGQSWLKLIPGKEHKNIMDHLQNLRKNHRKIVTYQHEVFDKEGKRKWMEWTDYVIRDKSGDFIEFQSVGQDITDRIEREKLEKEIEISQNSLKFKQNFLASMRHEMRTPLIGVKGIAQLLYKTTLSGKQKELIDILDQSAENLSEIIDQVLDYSRIESGKLQLNLQLHKTEELLKHANSFFSNICKKPIRFIPAYDNQLPEYASFDNKRINQVINNLIINAVKFTKEGQIGITLKKETQPVGSKEDEIMIRAEVSDTGIGIRPERQKNIFSPFSQVHEINTENYQGIGLGLSICKEIVELHGGEIGLSSIPDKGTTIWFTFKAILSSTNGNQTNSSAKKGQNHPDHLKILFVEDRKTTQKIVKLMLNAMGHTISTADNGQQAINNFNINDFDLILMDIQMPVMDGITATRTIKQNYKNSPPIVGLSANAFEGAREKYMELGMDEYLTKPLVENEFNRILQKLIIRR